MQIILLLCLILSGLGAQAQTTPAATAQQTGTIEALDAENGFRSYKFGTPMSDIPGLKKQGRGLYMASTEPLKIGEAELVGIYLTPHHGKLVTVILNAFGDDCERLLAALRVQYGVGQPVSSSEIVWRGQLVTMTLELKQTYLPYFYTSGGSSKPLSSCSVLIMSNIKTRMKTVTKNRTTN